MVEDDTNILVCYWVLVDPVQSEKARTAATFPGSVKSDNWAFSRSFFHRSFFKRVGRGPTCLRPAEVLVKEGRHRLIRARERLETLWAG